MRTGADTDEDSSSIRSFVVIFIACKEEESKTRRRRSPSSSSALERRRRGHEYQNSTYITPILLIKGCCIACYSPPLLLRMMMVQILRFCGSLVSLKILLLIMRVVCALCLSLILILSEFFRSLGFPAFCVCFYEVRNAPCSYRQPGGRGQLFSRRYCTHSV